MALYGDSAGSSPALAPAYLFIFPTIAAGTHASSALSSLRTARGLGVGDLNGGALPPASALGMPSTMDMLFSLLYAAAQTARPSYKAPLPRK